MMVSSVIIPQILLLILVIKNTAGKAIPASSPRLKQGCDKTCQTECLEVLNEYRANHDAPKLQFSETLADKAQKWADGGKFGYDMEARGKYGQLIEWDVKDELPTFKSVIKHWHDKERDYDFEKGKSKNGKTLHDFTQVVWKKAHKAGCGRGKMYGSRYYVVWMDADGVISPNISDGSENVGPPKREDIHWFEVTKIKAVGEPLYWNATNSTKPTTGDPKLRTKSSILPTDEEELNSIENEQHILNDANNIKEYVHDSLSKVFDQENLEVAKLRDEFERIDGDSNAHFESPSQNIYGSNDETAMNSAYGDNEESSSKEIRPGIGTFKLSDKVTNQPSNEEEQYPEEHGVGQKTTYSKGDENLGSLTQPQVPMGKLPVTVDVGKTKLTESMPTTVVHEELNISDANTAGKAKKNEHKVSSESRQVQNNSAGKRQKSESMSSQDDVREMAGVIMGKLSDNGSDVNQVSSKDKDRKLMSDDNLTADMKNELSKVAKFINTKLKDLSKDKTPQRTSRKELKLGYNAKEEGKTDDPMNIVADNEPQARPARITMVGAPLSFPEKKNQDVVKDIHEKVTALWTAHLKNKKEEDKKEKERIQTNGEDDPGSQYYQDGGDDMTDSGGSSSNINNSVQDFGHLHEGQYYDSNQHQGTSPDNYDQNPKNDPQFHKMHQSIANHEASFNGFQAPIRLHPGGDWFGPAISPASPDMDDPITHAMNVGPGGLYEYRKKYTSEDREKESDNKEKTEGISERNKNSLQSVLDIFDENGGSDDSGYFKSESKPALQPIRLPKMPAADSSKSFTNKNRRPEDHHDLLALPKELTERPDKETSLANDLPDIINDSPSTSKVRSEEGSQPGYFNQELGLNTPIFVDQNDNYQGYRSSNNDQSYYQSRAGHGNPMQQSMPVTQSQASHPPYGQQSQSNPMQSFGSPQSIHRGYPDHNQEQTVMQSDPQQTYNNQGYGYPQQSLGQGSAPEQTMIINGDPEQHFSNTPQIQKILKGVTLPSSVGVLLDTQRQQSGLTLSDTNNEKSPKNKPSSKGAQEVDNAQQTEEPMDESNGKVGGGKPSNQNNAGDMMDMPQMPPQQGQGGTSMPQDGSSNGAVITIDGHPVKEPYKSSEVNMAKGPFVYQTDTTIVMGGPQNAGSDSNTMMNSGGSAPISNPQNVPPSVGNSKGTNHRQGSEKSEKQGNQFEPDHLKRPSLITLLKEAEMANKTSKPSESEKKPSNSKENKGKSSEDEKNEKQPEGSTSSGERPDGSAGNEKQPSGSEGHGKQSSESAGNEKQPSKSAGNEKQSSESAGNEKQPSESEENEKQPSESERNEKQSSESAANKKLPSGSAANEKQSSESAGNEKPPSESEGHEKQPSGADANEKQSSESARNEKQSSKSAGNEKQPGGSAENKKPSEGQERPLESEGPRPGSTEVEKQQKEPSEEKPQGSDNKENKSNGSKDKEKEPVESSQEEGAGPSKGKQQTEGSSESEGLQVSSEGEKQQKGPSEEKPQGSSQNKEEPVESSQGKGAGTSKGKQETEGSSENKEESGGPIDNKNQPSGSKDNENEPSSSEDSENQPSDSKDNENQPSAGSEDNENKSSGSKDRENQSSGSEESESKPSGSVVDKGETVFNNKEKPSPLDNLPGNYNDYNQHKILSTRPESFEDEVQSNKAGTGVSIDGNKTSRPSEAIQSSQAPGAHVPLNTLTGSTSSEEVQPPKSQHHSVTQTDHEKLAKAKLLLPFSKLISKINHALGLDSPNSTLKVNHISLSSKHPSGTNSELQAEESVATENSVSSQEQVSNKPIATNMKGLQGKPLQVSQSVLQGNTAKQVDHQHIAVDNPEDTTGNQMKGLQGKPLQVSQLVLQGNTAKQVDHQYIAVDNPEDTTGNQIQGLEGKPLAPLTDNNHDKNNDQDIKNVDVSPAAQHGGMGVPSWMASHHPSVQGKQSHSNETPEGIHNNEGQHSIMSNPQEGHPKIVISPQKQLNDGHLSSTGSLSDRVEETQLIGAPKVQEIHVNPIVEHSHPGSLNTQSCTDNGERCPLWQKKGYCNSVLYTGFMKQHCKSTCGYCALPTIELQSERAKVIRYAYGEQVCNDSPNYEFSCPEWRVQGYCQKKEKEMRKFCSNTCNFCKRKKITKTKEEEKKKEDKKKEDEKKEDKKKEDEKKEDKRKEDEKKEDKKKEDEKKEDEKKEDEKEERVHDQPAKTGTSAKPDSTAHAQIGSASGQLQNYAHAQNGQGQNSAQAQAGNSAQAQAGNLGGQQPSYAHAQVGNASNPQSTAYAQGGSTYVQTQSSSSQQTGYAVAQAAATPEQQTYANAQSSSPSGQPSSAYAQNTPSSKNQSSSSTAHVQTGSPESPQNVAHAQTSPANDNAKKPSGKKKNGDGTVVETPHSRLHDMTLEEKVMSESPEYRTATSDYFIQTGDSEEGIDSESNLYDEAPTIHFSNTNANGPTNRDAKLQGILEPGLRRNTENDQGSNNIGRFLDDAELKAGFSKDDLKDMEAKDTEDEKVRTLMNRFDSDMGEEYNDVTKDGSIITAKRSDKKGTLASVSTEGCDQSCQRECLDAINSYRRNHKARPLVLDQDLATHAQDWADRKAYGHSPWAQQGMGGELIAVGSFYKTFTAAVKAWHDEVKDFDWIKGKLKKGSEIKHFKQLISKDAHVVGCGKSSVNGEPYYIAQMDTGINDDDTDNTGQEKRKLMEKPEIPDLGWYMNSSPYWKDLQARGSIPKKVHRNLL